MKYHTFLALIWCAALAGCSGDQAGTGDKNPDDGGTSDSDTDSDTDTDTDSDTDSDSDSDTAECGNGVVEGDEVCDDDNQVSGDGCNSTCTMNDHWDVVANSLTEGDQQQPTLACNTTSAVLAFSDWGAGDPSGAAVMIRLFGSDGMPVENALGGDEEFTANTETDDHQSQPRFALQDDGGFFVVWTHESGTVDGGQDVRGRVFDADGDPVTDDFAVSEATAGEQATPVAAVADDGSVLVVWTDDSGSGGDASGYGIKGRLFYDDGTPKTNGQTLDDGEFQINQVTAGNQFQPDVAWLGDRYLVVWTDASGSLDGDGYGVVGTVFDFEAFPLGPETDTLINTTTAGLQATPRVAHQPDLGAVVVWTDDSQTDDAAHYGIRARLVDFDCGGRPNAVTDSSDDFQVNTVIAGGQQMPAVATLDGGEFTAAWQDWSGGDGSGSSVRARQFEPDAEPIFSDLSEEGGDFQVNTTFWNAQITPALCATGSWFLAAWEDRSEATPDESGSAIRYRLLPGP